MSVDNLRTGDRASVRFRFIKSPEYLRSGMKLVFREGRTKAIGSISKLFPHVPAQTSNTRAKTRAQTAAAAASTSNPTTTDQSQPSKRNDSGEENRSGHKRPKQNKPTTDTPTEQNVDMDKNAS